MRPRSRRAGCTWWRRRGRCASAGAAARGRRLCVFSSTWSALCKRVGLAEGVVGGAAFCFVLCVFWGCMFCVFLFWIAAIEPVPAVQVAAACGFLERSARPPRVWVWAVRGVTQARGGTASRRPTRRSSPLLGASIRARVSRFMTRFTFHARSPLLVHSPSCGGRGGARTTLDLSTGLSFHTQGKARASRFVSF